MAGRPLRKGNKIRERREVLMHCENVLSDEVDPKELDWNESLWHAQKDCQEDGDDFSDVG